MPAKLLLINYSEAMFELRKLKHQQRPVSEFNSKQQLEEFFGKRMPPPQLDVSASNQTSASSLVSDRAKQLASASTNSQDFMPEGVRLEVRGVFEQHRVTETLQGPLQQEMNRCLQQNIEQRQRRQQGRRTRSGHVHQGHSELDNASDRLIAALRSRRRHRPRAAASPRHPRRHVRFVPPENGQYPMPRRDQSQIVDNLIQSPALNSLDAEAREEIVSEVRNLVQQQLVTSALSGEFRGVLELNIQVFSDYYNVQLQVYYAKDCLICVINILNNTVRYTGIITCCDAIAVTACMSCVSPRGIYTIWEQ